MGRWLSRDPIEEAGGLNLYGFIDNKSVNYWDERGEQSAVFTPRIFFPYVNPMITVTRPAINPLIIPSVKPFPIVLPFPSPFTPAPIPIVPDMCKCAKKSGKEKANDVPSWAEGTKVNKDMKPSEQARDIMDKKYGKDNWPQGPKTEYNKIKKYLERNRDIISPNTVPNKIEPYKPGYILG